MCRALSCIPSNKKEKKSQGRDKERWRNTESEREREKRERESERGREKKRREEGRENKGRAVAVVANLWHACCSRLCVSTDSSNRFAITAGEKPKKGDLSQVVKRSHLNGLYQGCVSSFPHLTVST